MKKFRLDVTISKEQEKSKKTLFFGLQKIISQKNTFFFKSKPLKIYNFGTNEKLLTCCNNAVYKKLLAEKNVFFQIKTVEDMKFC